MLAPSLGRRELIKRVRQAISLDDFSHKPVYEFSHGLVPSISSRHREVSELWVSQGPLAILYLPEPIAELLVNW